MATRTETTPETTTETGPETGKETAKESNKPVVSFSKRGVSVSVFENPVEGRDVPFYKAAIQRTYMKDGEFRHTTSFSTEDIPVLQTLLQDAFRRILELEDEKKKAARRGKSEAGSGVDAEADDGNLPF